MRKSITLMCRLNIVGAELAELGLIHAAIDVTGFGLLGHLSSMCRASGVGAEIVAAKVPVISREVFSLIAQDCVPGGTRQNLETANAIVEWNSTPGSVRLLLADAQTSGGLLLCVPPKRLQEVERVLKKNRTACAAIIGKVLRSSRSRICMTN
jgi:selenide,water dikinase